jgi:hypothetical protein
MGRARPLPRIIYAHERSADARSIGEGPDPSIPGNTV